jgi:2-dehydro-3-deoxyphosphooctonate aldolase (KDO 8-P synthase)
MRTALIRSTALAKPILVGEGAPLLLFSGPCQIESRDHCFKIAEHLLSITEQLPVSLVFKASFDKANRSSISNARGVGIDEGLAILQEIKSKFSLPVITDIHESCQAAVVAEVVDVIQIPAFLCRQTDLLMAAGATGKCVHIKKGQFLPPEDMKYAAQKVAQAGGDSILLCERGTCFGYRDLVVDMRGLVTLRDLGYPVIFDGTHSVQSLGGSGGGVSGGNRRFVEPLCRAAIAVGIDGIFLECHEEPERAPSDGLSMLPLDEMGSLLKRLSFIKTTIECKEK